MKNVWEQVKLWYNQASLFTQLNKWIYLVVIGLALVAASVWGVWAIRESVKNAVDARIETAVSAERQKVLAEVRAELKKSEGQFDRLVADSLNRASASVQRLEAQERAFQKSAADLEKRLRLLPDANDPIPSSTRELLRESKGRFND